MEPKKCNKTPGRSVRATKEPWMTEDEDEGDTDHVHLVCAAASGSTPLLRATL